MLVCGNGRFPNITPEWTSDPSACTAAVPCIASSESLHASRRRPGLSRGLRLGISAFGPGRGAAPEIAAWRGSRLEDWRPDSHAAFAHGSPGSSSFWWQHTNRDSGGTQRPAEQGVTRKVSASYPAAGAGRVRQTCASCSAPACYLGLDSSGCLPPMHSHLCLTCFCSNPSRLISLLRSSRACTSSRRTRELVEASGMNLQRSGLACVPCLAMIRDCFLYHCLCPPSHGVACFPVWEKGAILRPLERQAAYLDALQGGP